MRWNLLPYRQRETSGEREEIPYKYWNYPELGLYLNVYRISAPKYFEVYWQEAPPEAVVFPAG